MLTGHLKKGGNLAFDEAHFYSPIWHPGLVLLYQLGLGIPFPPTNSTKPTPVLYPSLPKLLASVHKTASTIPLPLTEPVPMPSTHLLAAAVSLLFLLPEQDVHKVVSIVMLGDYLDLPFLSNSSLTNAIQYLDYSFHFDVNCQSLQLINCAKGTTAHYITKWCCCPQPTYLLANNKKSIENINDLILKLVHLHQSNIKTAILTFTFDIIHNHESASGTPLLYFDQMHNTCSNTSVIKNCLPLQISMLHKSTIINTK